MNIQKAKPIKWTNTETDTTFYGIVVMIDGQWMGLLDDNEKEGSRSMVEFTTYKEAKKYCVDLIEPTKE